MSNLKIFILSIVINLILVYLFVVFIGRPLNEASKTIAQALCINWHQKCEFK